MTELPRAILYFARRARKKMRKFMPRASCIGAARTTIEVMKLISIKAVEKPVSMVFAVPTRDYVRVSGLNPEEKADLRSKSISWRDEIEGENAWDGHLIVLVEDRWLIDPSIDQVAAEEFGVAEPDEILVMDTAGQEWNPAWFDVHATLILDSGEKAHLEYRSILDTSYLETPAWNDEGLPRLAEAIAFDMAVHAMAEGMATSINRDMREMAERIKKAEQN